MRVLIITGGNIEYDFALSFLKKEKFDEIIAVDGGLEAARRLEAALREEHFRLTHIVGDFDTVSPEVLRIYLGRGDVRVHAYAPEKDETDTDIALKLAMELCGADAVRETPPMRNDTYPVDSLQGDGQLMAFKQDSAIVILGATGTRLDHVLANLQMLKFPMAAGIDAVIVDAHNRIRMIEREFVVRGDFGRYISLIPVSESLRGVEMAGFKYPLSGRDVQLGESLCVSNELTAPEGVIRIGAGSALLIESRD